MLEVILKKDIIDYLNQEILRLRNTDPSRMVAVRDESFLQGYKTGKIAAYEKILTHVWSNQFKVSKK